jgi:VWFA-related protein
VTVTIKLVQIFVLDAKGHPALDLESSDFALRDNGQLRTITEFEKHFLHVPTATLEAAPLPPAQDRSSVMNRKFIFLVDYGGNDLEGIMKSKNAALEFMDSKLQPGDEVALFAFSTMSGLTLHEYLTADHEKVRAAIKKMRDVPGIRPAQDDITTSSDSTDPNFDHRPAGMELMNLEVFGRHGGPAGAGADPRVLFSQVEEWAKALGRIPGQKNVILFTRGFGTGIVVPSHPLFPFFQAMARALATANAPVFSVNTTTGMAGKIAAGVFPEASLEYLSNLTGGKYVGDVDFYARNAEDIQSATANYYVLGYSIPASWDGRFHEIKVEVRRPGYRVFGQSGYTNPLPFNKLSPLEKHLHLLDLALAEKGYTEQHLVFPLVALPFSGGNGPNALLLAAIPVERLRQDVGDKTEFISLVLDQDKTIVNGSRFEIDWATVRGERACQYSAVSLPVGRYDCRVVIRNLDNGRGAVGACSVEIPARATAGLWFDPPLLLVDGTEIPYINVSGRDKVVPGAAVSLFQVFPFPPKEFVPLVGDLKPGTASLYAVLRSSEKGVEDSDLGISAWLVPDGSAEKIPLAVEILSLAAKEDGAVRFLQFELPSLRSGRYELYITAEDPALKVPAETKTELRIR